MGELFPVFLLGNLLDLLWGFLDERMIKKMGRDRGEAERMPKPWVYVRLGIEVCSEYLYKSMRAVQAQIEGCLSMHCELAHGS